jgi:exocyst complex component 7
MDNILGGHKEEPKETVLNVWTSGMHIMVGVLGEMRRQLNGQDLGWFNMLKEDYFSEEAAQSGRFYLHSDPWRRITS